MNSNTLPVVFMQYKSKYPVLCFKEKKYHKNKERGSKAYYRCSNSGCHGRGILDKEKFIITHDHDQICLPNTNGMPNNGQVRNMSNINNAQSYSEQIQCFTAPGFPNHGQVNNMSNMNNAPFPGQIQCLAAPALNIGIPNQSFNLNNIQYIPGQIQCLIPLSIPNQSCNLNNIQYIPGQIQCLLPLMIPNQSSNTSNIPYIPRQNQCSIAAPVIPNQSSKTSNIQYKNGQNHSVMAGLEVLDCATTSRNWNADVQDSNESREVSIIARYELIQSTKEKDYIYSNKYLYQKEKTNKEVTYYRCINKICKARGKLCRGIFYALKEHCHLDDESKYLALRTRNTLKGEMLKNPDHLRSRVYHRVMSDLILDERILNEPKALPILKNVDRMLKRCVMGSAT